MATYCDSCLTAAYDEGAEDEETQELLLAELGRDIADHCCDQQETGEPCSCPCH